MKRFIIILILGVATTLSTYAQDAATLFARAGQQFAFYESEKDASGASIEMYDNLMDAYSNYTLVLNSSNGKAYEPQIKARFVKAYDDFLSGGVYYSQRYNNTKALACIKVYINLPNLPLLRSELLERDERYPQVLHFAGVTSYNQKEYNEAIIYFQEYLNTKAEENLRDVFVYLNLIYGNDKKYLEQELVLEQATEKFPLSLDFLYSLVNVHIATKNMSKLLATIDRIETIDPNDTKVLPIKARIIEGQGRNKEALDIYTRLNAINPSPELVQGIARSSYNVATEIVNEASKIADDAEYVQKKQEAMPYLRTARETFESILSDTPNSNQHLNGLASIYASMDMKAEAIVLNKIIDEGGDYTSFNSRLLAYNASSGGMQQEERDVPLPNAPAKLIAEITSFSDGNNNQIIDAGEVVTINFQVTNSGEGDAYNLRIRLSEQQGLERYLEGARQLDGGHLKVGETKSYTMNFLCDRSLPTASAIFDIYVFEGNGFDADPIQLAINTQEYIMPKLTISDYQFTADNGSSISIGDNGKLSVVIQNMGAATAHNIALAYTLPQNIFATEQSEFKIDSLAPGEATIIDYGFVVNKRFANDSVVIVLNASESSRTSYINESLKMKVGDYLAASTTMRIEGISSRQKVDIENVKLTYKSELLENVPVGNINKNRYALIIGNEDYSMTGANSEINVPYAVNDAVVFREYCVRTFGVPESQIKLIPNATAGMLYEQLDWLVNIASTNPEAELIFYFSGHGNNDEKTKDPYLLPVDITGKNIRLGLSLNDLYEKLATNPVKYAYVFLDACFSGGHKSEAPLIAQKGVRVVAKKGEPQGNTIVLSSSSGDQTSSVYNEKKQGYYTYFLLKSIQESQGNISMAELFSKTSQEVKKATAIMGKMQEPQYNLSPSLSSDWQSIQLMQPQLQEL